MIGVLLALTPVVAHHYGAQRHAEIGADVRQCAWLALALSLLAFAALKHPDPLLAFSRLTPEVESKVRAYLDGSAWAVPGVMFFRVFYGFTNGIGRPRPVMSLNLLGLALKAPLNWVFMYGHFGLPAMGGAGCGWSSAVIMWTSHAGLGLVPARCGLRALRRLRPLRLATPVRTARIPAARAADGRHLPGRCHGLHLHGAVHRPPRARGFRRAPGRRQRRGFRLHGAAGAGRATGVVVGQALGAGDSRRARHAGFARDWRSAAARRHSPVPRSASAPGRWRASTPRSRLSPPPRRALLSIVAVYHLADAVQAVMAQVLRGYKRATVPMVIYALSLWGVGLGGGYLLGADRQLRPGARRGGVLDRRRGEPLVVAGAGVLAYFLRVSAQAIPAPATTRRSGRPCPGPSRLCRAARQGAASRRRRTGHRR
jgi:MATE family multidrug resistance protein